MDGKNHLVKSGYYEPCQLFGERTTDEDGHSLTVYTDKLGRKVLERRASDDGNNDTYFVYNDLGQLRFVLSPEYQNDNDKAIFGYEYRYDNKGNVIKKILPQCEYIQYWYDTADRLIYMQDGRMRSQGIYRFYLYDNLSRVVVEGTCSACNRGSSVTHTAFCVSNAGFLGTGYSLDNNLNLENARLEVANYYDNYDFLNLPLFKDNAALKKESSHATPVCAYGLSTGTITATSRGELLLNTLYYDAKGQVTESRRTLPDNALLVTKNSYTFTSNPERTEQTLYKDGNVHRSVIVNSYNDHNDKLETTTLSIDGQPAKQVASIDYDDLGRIGDLYHGGKSANVEKTHYTYNLRGWTTDIASKNFEEHLTYNAGSQGTPYYSGNISTQQWKTGGDGVLRGYKFSYDNLNRLTNAAYGEGPSFSNNQGHYNETITDYTSNGAIEGIVRNGLMQNGQYGAIDDLDITLNGNQLERVDDNAAPVLRNGAFDFYDNKIKTEGDEYRYDENGALIYDANRGIKNIEYDLRNNPVLIQFSDGSTTEYVYSAIGEKLRTIHRSSINDFDGRKDFHTIAAYSSYGIDLPVGQRDILAVDSTDYIDNFVFENGRIDKYLFSGGYYTCNEDSSKYHYYLTDHLGNNRAVVSDNGTLEQTTHYYPFGSVYADAGKNPDFQKYKYTGKELDLIHGLNTYDHGARQNYSILGVWDRVDPLAEKYYNVSPYTVCINNPLLSVDPNGEDSYYTQDGEYAFTNMSETDNIYIISKLEFIRTENNVSYYYVYDRHRLDETDDFLSADAYSRIFTNILERYGVFDNEYKIYKDAIQVFVGKDVYGKIQTYSKSERNADSNGGQRQLAHTSLTTHKITANIWDNDTNTKSGTHKDNRFMYATEHNVLSALGDHEYKAHRVKGITSEKAAYKFQRSALNWNLTSPDFIFYITNSCAPK